MPCLYFRVCDQGGALDEEGAKVADLKDAEEICLEGARSSMREVAECELVIVSRLSHGDSLAQLRRAWRCFWAIARTGGSLGHSNGISLMDGRFHLVENI